MREWVDGETYDQFQAWMDALRVNDFSSFAELQELDRLENGIIGSGTLSM